MNHLIQQFRELGIAERETKTYLALLESGESNAHELHRITGLQRTKMYAVLSRMVEHGLCHERVEGRNRYFSAVDPETVFDTFRNQWRTDAAEKERIAGDLFTTLMESYQNAGDKNYLDSIEVIRNKMHVHRTYLSLINATKNEVCVFSRPPFAATKPELFNEQIDAQRKAYDRGVHNRSILIKGTVPFEEAEFPKLGDRDEMRFLDSLPIKMFVFDVEKVLIAIPSAPVEVHDFSMILIDDPGFATIARIAFEHYWVRATPLETLIEQHRNGLREND